MGELACEHFFRARSARVARRVRTKCSAQACLQSIYSEEKPVPRAQRPGSALPSYDSLSVLDNDMVMVRKRNAHNCGGAFVTI